MILLDFKRVLWYAALAARARVFLFTFMKNRIPLLLILLVAALFMLDQTTKWAVVLNYEFDWLNGFCREVTPVWSNGFSHFNIVRVHNTGVAFGTGNGTVWAPFVFLGVQVAALVWLTVLFRRGFFSTKLLKLAWALIMAGVLGNMADRLTQGFFIPGAEQLSFFQNLINGYVVDFLDFSFPWIHAEGWPDGYHWPSFNVADSCVCIAATLFLLSSFFMPAEQKGKGEKKDA